MVRPSRPARVAPRGLTLLELIVVLVILVAIAGILVPLLPNMLQRAHSSAGANNIAALVRQIQTHDALFNGHPNNLDSLIIGATVDGGTILNEGVTEGTITVNDATADQIASLNAIGITTVEGMSATPANATFEPYHNAAPTPVTITTNVQLVSLDTLGKQQLNLPSGNNYVLFGLGSRSTAIGKSMADAPVHFPEAGEDPAQVYSRFLLVYEIPAGGAPARLAAVAAAHHAGEEFVGLSAHLGEYFETVSSQN